MSTNWTDRIDFYLSIENNLTLCETVARNVIKKTTITKNNNKRTLTDVRTTLAKVVCYFGRTDNNGQRTNLPSDYFNINNLHKSNCHALSSYYTIYSLTMANNHRFFQFDTLFSLFFFSFEKCKYTKQFSKHFKFFGHTQIDCLVTITYFDNLLILLFFSFSLFLQFMINSAFLCHI